MPEGTMERPPAEKRKNGGCNGYQEFCDKLKSIKGRVALFTHAYPDPDAVGSMMGMAWMLNRAFELECDLFYDGEVSHPQNGVIKNLLDPGLRRVNEWQAEKYALNILLDTIPENAGVGKASKKPEKDEDEDKEKKKPPEFGVVVDHHRDLPQDYSGVLVHKKVGSCAAIVFDMIKHFVKTEDWFDKDSDFDTKVATALIAGIVTDTEHMMSDDSTEYEFKAYSELFPYRDGDALKEIVFYKRPKFWIDKKAEGCAQAILDERGYAIVGLGVIPDVHRDLIADMAEEMVSWTSVETAIAFAVIGGTRVEGSVRSNNASLTVSDFCRKLGGQHGSGGGKHGKGAYRLPLAGFSIDPDEEEQDVQEAWETIKKRETKRIMRSIMK